MKTKARIKINIRIFQAFSKFLFLKSNKNFQKKKKENRQLIKSNKVISGSNKLIKATVVEVFFSIIV